eukprot:gnl/TRDRNA2_/TRDRNA2_161406_c0_seq1.p1 gnl/TRDRNA2_/TRDRNA2_161406_c0~~gnl/TRDRNA2_/TRDRNA2_161406_c0_seq1.p1  ORF type:complete len:323 (+),score=54.14 gnl/TRDRNA2_/TRDRNA2_161406_c0_seq1:60-1028(+)
MPKKPPKPKGPARISFPGTMDIPDPPHWCRQVHAIEASAVAAPAATSSKSPRSTSPPPERDDEPPPQITRFEGGTLEKGREIYKVRMDDHGERLFLWKYRKYFVLKRPLPEIPDDPEQNIRRLATARSALGLSPSGVTAGPPRKRNAHSVPDLSRNGCDASVFRGGGWCPPEGGLRRTNPDFEELLKTTMREPAKPRFSHGPKHTKSMANLSPHARQSLMLGSVVDDNGGASLRASLSPNIKSKLHQSALSVQGHPPQTSSPGAQAQAAAPPKAEEPTPAASTACETAVVEEPDAVAQPMAAEAEAELPVAAAVGETSVAEA